MEEKSEQSIGLQSGFDQNESVALRKLSLIFQKGIYAKCHQRNSFGHLTFSIPLKNWKSLNIGWTHCCPYRRKNCIAKSAGTRKFLVIAATCQHYLPCLPSSYPAQHHLASASALFLHPVVASSCHPLPWPAPSHQQKSCQLRLW